MMVTLVMSSVTTPIYDGDISHVQCYHTYIYGDIMSSDYIYGDISHVLPHLYMMVTLVMSSVTTPIYDGDISHVQCYHTYI